MQSRSPKVSRSNRPRRFHFRHFHPRKSAINLTATPAHLSFRVSSMSSRLPHLNTISLKRFRAITRFPIKSAWNGASEGRVIGPKKRFVWRFAPVTHEDVRTTATFRDYAIGLRFQNEDIELVPSHVTSQ